MNLRRVVGAPVYYGALYSSENPKTSVSVAAVIGALVAGLKGALVGGGVGVAAVALAGGARSLKKLSPFGHEDPDYNDPLDPLAGVAQLYFGQDDDSADAGDGGDDGSFDAATAYAALPTDSTDTSVFDVTDSDGGYTPGAGGMADTSSDDSFTRGQDLPDDDSDSVWETSDDSPEAEYDEGEDENYDDGGGGGGGGGGGYAPSDGGGGGGPAAGPTTTGGGGGGGGIVPTGAVVPSGAGALTDGADASAPPLSLPIPPPDTSAAAARRRAVQHGGAGQTPDDGTADLLAHVQAAGGNPPMPRGPHIASAPDTALHKDTAMKNVRRVQHVTPAMNPLAAVIRRAAPAGTAAAGRAGTMPRTPPPPPPVYTQRVAWTPAFNPLAQRIR